MSKLNLNQEIPCKVKKSNSAREFSLTLLAHSLFKITTIDSLIAKSLYENKIQILDHQTQTALNVLNNFSYRALLADEVGLGKTIEAGILLKEFIIRKLVKKILILTPATLKFQWKEEMHSKFDLKFEIADKTVVYDNDLVIASIDTAKTKSHKNYLSEKYWDLIIIDEAHKLKNSNTQNYKLIKSLNFERCLMLTATPLQNNLFELWALIDLLHPGFLGTKQNFTKKYISDKEGLKIKDSSNLQKKLSQIMIRNLRKDTNIKFVKRIVKTHILNYDLNELKFYNLVISFIKKEYDKVKDKDTTNIDTSVLTEDELKKLAKEYRQKGLLTFSLIMLTRQITSSIKTGVEALKRYAETIEDDKKKFELETIIEQGKEIGIDKKLEQLIKIIKKEKNKIIIFTTFIHTQKMLEMELSLNGFEVVVFNGKMTPVEKEEKISDFKENKQVLICTDAGSEGRNLQFANIMVNYDLPWNPMRVEQRIGRIHRFGQTKDVVIHNLAISNTIETYILNRLYEKINLFQVAIGEMDLILSQLKKPNFEREIFASVFDDDGFDKELVEAKTKAKNINQFDNDLFGGGLR